MKNIKYLATLIFLFVSACGNNSSGELTIKNVWARPVLAGNNGAVYFSIENGTSKDDVLLSANSTIAPAAEIHMSMADGNSVMTMQMQEAVTVPARGKVELKPGGLHIMLVGLKQDLKNGDTFNLTLNFENAGEIVVQVEVKEQP